MYLLFVHVNLTNIVNLTKKGNAPSFQLFVKSPFIARQGHEKEVNSKVASLISGTMLCSSLNLT